MTKLIVLVGSSGVGKSSLARALQEQLLPQLWFHFSVDTLFYCLPASVTRRADRDNDWSALSPGQVVGGALASARALLEAGNNVIYDAVVASEIGARRLLQAFEGHHPCVVELTCSWDEIARRTMQRGDRTLQEAERGFRHARGHLAAHHALDTTAATPEQLAVRLAGLLRASAKG